MLDTCLYQGQLHKVMCEQLHLGLETHVTESISFDDNRNS